MNNTKKMKLSTKIKTKLWVTFAGQCITTEGLTQQDASKQVSNYSDMMLQAFCDRFEKVKKLKVKKAKAS